MPPHGHSGGGFGGGHHGGPGFGGGHHGGFIGGPGFGIGGFGGGFGPRPLLGFPRYGVYPGYGFGLGTVGALGAGALLAGSLSSSRSYQPEVIVVQQTTTTQQTQQPQQVVQQPQQVVVQQPQPSVQYVSAPPQQTQQVYVPTYNPPVSAPTQKYDMIDVNALRLPPNTQIENGDVHYTNQPLPVSESYPFVPHNIHGNYTVQLTNLPDNVTWEELEQLFGGYHIVRVDARRDGTGFVEFGDQQTYENALRNHGSTIRGRSVHIISHP